MAFFEGDEPTRVNRPRRPGGARTSGGGGGGGTDQQTLRNRRLVAAGLAVLLFILLVVVVNSCLDSRARNSLKDYNADVGNVIRQSDEVGRRFFEVMAGGDQSPVEQQTEINQLRVTAERQIGTAEDFDVPGDMRDAQRNLLLTLNLRQTGLAKVGEQIRTARAGADAGDEAQRATEQITAQMQAFLASDVVYDTRVLPLIRQTLDEKEIGGQQIVDSQFLPSLDWLSVETVAERVGGAAGGGPAGGGGPPEPGTHGHGLTSVTLGETALEPGATNRVAAGANLAFTVQFQNQGENDEQDVNVRIRIRGGGGRPVSASKRVDETKAGSNAEVTIPLTQAPPIGTPVTVEVVVDRVPGEEMTENNRQSYPVIFTR